MDTGWTDAGVVEIDGQLVRYTYHREAPEQHAHYHLELRWPDGSHLWVSTNSRTAVDAALDEITTTATERGVAVATVAMDVANNTPASRAFFDRIYHWAMQHPVEGYTDTDI